MLNHLICDDRFDKINFSFSFFKYLALVFVSMGKATVRTSQIICKWHTWSFLSWTLCQIMWHSTKLISLTIGNWTSVHKLVNIKGTVELILPLSGKYPLKIEEYSVFHPSISCPSVRGSRDTIMATPADTSDRLTLCWRAIRKRQKNIHPHVHLFCQFRIPD